MTKFFIYDGDGDDDGGGDESDDTSSGGDDDGMRKPTGNAGGAGVEET